MAARARSSASAWSSAACARTARSSQSSSPSPASSSRAGGRCLPDSSETSPTGSGPRRPAAGWATSWNPRTTPSSAHRWKARSSRGIQWAARLYGYWPRRSSGGTPRSRSSRPLAGGAEPTARPPRPLNALPSLSVRLLGVCLLGLHVRKLLGLDRPLSGQHIPDERHDLGRIVGDVEQSHVLLTDLALGQDGPAEPVHQSGPEARAEQNDGKVVDLARLDQGERL